MPSTFHRTDRVSAELRRELGVLVHAAVRDHVLPSASVSDVEVSRDLDVATVWIVSLLPEQGEPAVQALNALAAQLRGQLARRIRLRRVPALRFRYDASVDRGERIEALLRTSPPADA